jgi:phosphatidylserine/phosphatidylglycerophosphate/cardiolipin synthase-like enzyme
VQSYYQLPQLAAADPSFLLTLEAYTSAAHAGNSVDVLLNGDQIFPAALEAIRSARKTITYAQYFYEEGSIGVELMEAFAERCRAGVQTHILLDGFGTLMIPAQYRDSMTSAGCEVSTFRPLNPLVLLSPFGFGRGNNRNHRRILVVDGRVGFAGGVGVSPKWRGNGRTKGHWRQTDVRIEGPVVASLQAAFVQNWLEATGNVLGGELYFPPLARRGPVVAQVVRSSPAEGSFSMYTMFLLAISSARKTIYITNPYFLPGAGGAEDVRPAGSHSSSSHSAHRRHLLCLHLLHFRPCVLELGFLPRFTDPRENVLLLFPDMAFEARVHRLQFGEPRRVFRLELRQCLDQTLNLVDLVLMFLPPLRQL